VPHIKNDAKFFKESKLSVLEWPGNSSDLSPIENVWAILKKRLQKYDCTTKSKLIEGIIQIWYHDEELQNLCSNVLHSMPTRVACQCERKQHKLLKPLKMLFSQYKNKNSIFYKFFEFCEVSQLICAPLYLGQTTEMS